jgi:tripartite-type tricarboxylate transporter receptor subunit TctC
MPTIPLIFDVLSREADKPFLAFMVGPTGMARPFAAPPGVSPARASLLRRAFDATMKDPAFRAEADQMQADLDPSTGEAVQALVQRIYATPADVIARAKGLLKGN